MEVPAHILWGVLGFVMVSAVKIGFRALKDIDAAHVLIRELKTEIKNLKGKE